MPSTRLAPLASHPPFLFYVTARGFSEFSYQIGTVAVGWQVYALTRSAFDLGLVGLVQFVPSALLVFAAGHVADRYDRKRIVQICQFTEALTAAFLAWGTVAGWLNLVQIFAALTLFGVATAFESPAAAALLPAVAPAGLMQKSTAVSTAAWQVATIGGPALGGLAYAISPGVPYAAMAVFWLFSAILIGAISTPRTAAPTSRATLSSVFAGVGFIRRNPQYWAQSRWTYSRYCSAERQRCCRSTHATFCIPARGDSACCAARRPSGRCSCPPCSPAIPLSDAQAFGCSKQ